MSFRTRVSVPLYLLYGSMFLAAGIATAADHVMTILTNDSRWYVPTTVEFLFGIVCMIMYYNEPPAEA